ncbi:MAG: YihY/virulence factor BrkB family protein [Cyanobacteriota bacterium]|nr:YihY/virulence factor BrkB family protein [Cyanobacteriota bacterium]
MFWFAGRLWLRHDCVDLSAAFAYHSLQSVLPAVLIALSVAARLLGNDDGLVDALLQSVARWMPAQALSYFELVLERFLRQGFGAGLFGVVLLFLTSTNAYLTLQRGADRIWKRRPSARQRLTFLQLFSRYLKLRVKGFGLLLLMGLFIGLDQLISNQRLLGSLDLRAALMNLVPVSLQWQRPVNLGFDLLSSLIITFAGAQLFLWWLPSSPVAWRRLLPGAALCSVALTGLNLLLGRVVLALGLRFSTYGVVGGVLLLTLWVWLVGVIIYYAQCFSVVCSSRLHPNRPFTSMTFDS